MDFLCTYEKCKSVLLRFNKLCFPAPIIIYAIYSGESKIGCLIPMEPTYMKNVYSIANRDSLQIKTKQRN